jgi:hypothetical protein
VWRRAVFSVAILWALSPASATAEPLRDLQLSLAEAEKNAEALGAQHARLHRDTMTALAKAERAGTADKRNAAVAALTIAEQREANIAIGELQANAALRRARQALAEAVNDYVEQGEILERAALRAAQGEVAPSVRDLLVCDGPDCVAVPRREHAALVVMGAIGPAFDPSKWAPDGLITALAYMPSDPPIALLRQAAETSTHRLRQAEQAAKIAHDALQGGGADQAAVEAYARRRTDADAAMAEKAATDERLNMTLRKYADIGRALKRAALLAGDGYRLKPDGRLCYRNECVGGTGLEAAAFIVIEAADDIDAGLKSLSAFVLRTPDGRVVFR